jgi:3-hydroxybutyryl-CoA dehydratase
MNAYTFDELQEGMEEDFTKKITHEDILSFSEIVGDKNPLHLDKEYAASTEFKRPLVFGLLVNSLLSTMAGMYLPGKYSLILAVESFFKKPCFEGDNLRIKARIDKKIDSQKTIILKTEITNQNSEIIQIGKMFIKVLK